MPVTTTAATSSAAPTSSSAASTVASPNRTGLSRLDAAFIQSLDEYDVEYGAPADAIRAAKAGCANLDIGTNHVADLRAIVEIFQMTAGHTRSEAENFVGFAVFAYCPEYNQYVTF